MLNSKISRVGYGFMASCKFARGQCPPYISYEAAAILGKWDRATLERA